MLRSDEISGVEWAIALFFVIVAARVLRLQNTGVGWVALITLAAIAAVTVQEATQFMTQDEHGITTELLTSEMRGTRQLNLGAFKSGATFLALPVVRTMEELGAAPQTIRILLKALWWTVGNLLVLWMGVILARLALSDVGSRPSSLSIAVAYASLAILPTTQLALKTVNYDLLSMALGVLALLTTTLAWRSGSWRHAGASVVMAALAAQEKLTGSLVLVGLIALVALAAAWSAESRSEGVRRAILTAAALVLGATLIFAVSLELYSVLAWPAPTAGLWRGLLDPFATWIWAPLSLIVPIKTVLDYRLAVALATTMAMLAAIALLAAFAPQVRARAHAGAVGRCSRPHVALAIAVGALFAVGAIGASSLNGYWAPYAPSPLDGLTIAKKLNGITLHIGATTLPAHMAGMVLYALAVLVVAVPSGLWLVGLAGSLTAWRLDPKTASHAYPLAALLIGVSLVLPIAAALSGAPFANRYFNTSVLLLTCGLLLPGLAVLGSLTAQRAGGGASAALGLAFVLIAETMPFRPLYAAFRPFWLEYADAQRAEPGRLNASWMDWGESVMLAAKKIERSCVTGKLSVPQSQCSHISLIPQIPGLWLEQPDHIAIGTWPRRGEAVAASEKVYYLFSRLTLIQTTHHMPTIQPDFVVAFRGYTLAWIYRGDRLADSGYSLYPP